MEKKLQFGEVISSAFTIGLKNFPSLIGCYILWILTIWIPYLNVGTTIAIVTIPASLSKGKVISPLEIFDGKYRKYMGDFFLVNGLKGVIVGIAYLFMIVPGIVLAISYCLSTLLVVDKGKDAVEALKISRDVTEGNKWAIFFTYIVLLLPFVIFGMIWSPLAIIYAIIVGPVMFGAIANIYGQLAADVK
jgi:hypothetical protein